MQVSFSQCRELAASISAPSALANPLPFSYSTANGHDSSTDYYKLVDIFTDDYLNTLIPKVDGCSSGTQTYSYSNAYVLSDSLDGAFSIGDDPDTDTSIIASSTEADYWNTSPSFNLVTTISVT